jgi:hypothetical protein
MVRNCRANKRGNREVKSELDEEKKKKGGTLVLRREMPQTAPAMTKCTVIEVDFTAGAQPSALSSSSRSAASRGDDLSSDHVSSSTRPPLRFMEGAGGQTQAAAYWERE